MTNRRKLKTQISAITGKLNISSLLLIAVFLCIGAIGGVLSYSIICRNDTFEVLGEKNIVYNVGETAEFSDEKVKIISFGNDISSSVQIETNMEVVDSVYVVNTTEEAEYYIKYTIEDFKYGGIVLYRTISVVENT